MSDDTRMLVEAAQLGEEAERFVASRLGQQLMHDIEMSASDSYEALKKHDPEDSKGIKKLQDEINWAEAIRDRLALYVRNAEMAIANLERLEAEAMDG
ncbi:MAG: hypothetical protein ACWGQW_23140 [bacterium]